MVWLDGGPGLSSMLSLFSMHGPFSITADFDLVPRVYTCIKTLNVIYIDNPVGSGEKVEGGGRVDEWSGS